MATGAALTADEVAKHCEATGGISRLLASCGLQRVPEAARKAHTRRFTAGVTVALQQPHQKWQVHCQLHANGADTPRS